MQGRKNARMRGELMLEKQVSILSPALKCRSNDNKMPTNFDGHRRSGGKISVQLEEDRGGV